MTYCYRLIYDDSTEVDEWHDKMKNALEHLWKFYEQYPLGSNDQNLGGQLVSSTSNDYNHYGDGDNNKDGYDFDFESFSIRRKKCKRETHLSLIGIFEMNVKMLVILTF